MNTFDYWFDYIVRNGTYVPSCISVSYWILKTNGFSYKARFVSELDHKERYIMVLKDGHPNWSDIVTFTNTRTLNRERLLSETFLPLISMRRIV